MGVVNGQQLAGAVFPPLEGHGGQGGQTLLIQLQAYVLAAADAAAHGGHGQQQQQAQRQADQRALAGAAHGAEAVVGSGGLHRLGQQLHTGAAHHIIGGLGIYRDDRLKDRQRIVRIRTGDLQGKEIGVGDGGGGNAAVDPVRPHGLTQAGGEIVRLDQIGEGLTELLGGGFVVVAGAAGDIRGAAGVDPDGEGHLAGVHGGIGPPCAHQPQDAEHQHQRQRDPVQPPENRPELMHQAGEIDIALVPTVKLLFFHARPPPFFDSCPWRSRRNRRSRHRPRSRSPVRSRNRSHSHTRSRGWRRAGSHGIRR